MLREIKFDHDQEHVMDAIGVKEGDFDRAREIVLNKFKELESITKRSEITEVIYNLIVEYSEEEDVMLFLSYHLGRALKIASNPFVQMMTELAD